MRPKKRSLIIAAIALGGSVVLPLVVTFGPLAVKDPTALSATLTAAVLVYLALIGSTLVAFADDISTRISTMTLVEPVPEGEFYARFLEAIRTSQNRVKICYFSNKSPIESVTHSTKDYYRRLPLEIKKKREVEFQRIVRLIPSMRSWIEQMVDDLGDVPNFSLACYPGTRPDVDATELVSVQCVDKNRVFLVAVGRQQESRDPRDILVQSEHFNLVWNEYFDRMWDNSLVVIDRGRLNQENLRKVREALGTDG